MNCINFCLILASFLVFPECLGKILNPQIELSNIDGPIPLSNLNRSNLWNPEYEPAYELEGNITMTSAPTTCNCGVVNIVSRIVGGKETEVNEYPWLMELVSKSGTLTLLF